MNYRKLAAPHWDKAAAVLEEARKLSGAAARGRAAAGVWHVWAARILCDAGNIEHPPGCDDVLEQLRAVAEGRAAHA